LARAGRLPPDSWLATSAASQPEAGHVLGGIDLIMRFVFSVLIFCCFESENLLAYQVLCFVL
jgi:hypothetical protein